MPRAVTVVRKPAVKADRIVDTVTLNHAARSRRHAHLHGEAGLHIDVDLEMETVLNDGDALRLEDGGLVQVRAAQESLLEVRSENPMRLTRLAWHLGSQHGLAEVTAEAVYVPNDPATAELVRGQGCTASPVLRAFRPEQALAACDHDHHGHDHHGHAHHDHGHHDHAHHDHGHHDHAHHDHHDHGHGHDQGHAHAHSHAEAHARAHHDHQDPKHGR
ncbi:MAG: urease accessory protein UreE [Microvirga sp.]